MITLTLRAPHRSILKFPNTIIPDFTIVTGVNGSGKSQLLEAIKNNHIAITNPEISSEKIKLFTWADLAPTSPGAADPIQLRRDRAVYITTAVENLQRAKLTVFNRAIHTPPSRFSPNIDAASIALNKALSQMEDSSQINRELTTQPHLRNTYNSILNAFGGNTSIIPSLAKYALSQNISILDLNSSQIEKIIPFNWNPVDIFQQNFSQIFASYHKAADDNSYNLFLNERNGEKNETLSAEDFILTHGEPPWNFVNRLLEEAKLDYTISRPIGRSEIPFEAKLIKNNSGVEVSFQDLSSGEKIIMSFALCLYNTKEKLQIYPKLLLFDEIDAPLHPSMTKDLIHIISQVLVKEKGVKVIMTTHSPSTVAFAPDGALFKLNKTPQKLEASSGDEAIQTLSSGYISVTRNSRFVITEAKQDQEIYTAIFRKLAEHKAIPNHPALIFIRASDKKDKSGGGKGQVKDWSTKLPAAGLNQVYGIIDRDINNHESPTVKVLQRYSLENYLLDPILIYAVLMLHRKHTHIYDCGIKDSDFSQLKNLETPNLQKIINAINDVVKTHCPELSPHHNTFEVEYINGKKLDQPTWLRDYRGHDLETAIRNTFSKAINPDFIITKNELKDFIEMLTERAPQFTSIDFPSIFKEIQSVKTVG